MFSLNQTALALMSRYLVVTVHAVILQREPGDRLRAIRAEQHRKVSVFGFVLHSDYFQHATK